MLAMVTGFIIAITGVIAGILALLSDELKKNKKLKYILVAVLLALSFYAMLGSLLSLSTAEGLATETSKTNVPIAIDSTKDWQSTGISVEMGETIIVTVVGGKWTALREEISDPKLSNLPEYYWDKEIWANYSFESAGSGGTANCSDYFVPNCPVPTAKVGTLVAKIGATGQPFAIGNKKTFTVQYDGVLFLRINDGENEGIAGLSDNGGVLAVEIEVVK